MDAFKITLVD